MTTLPPSPVTLLVPRDELGHQEERTAPGAPLLVAFGGMPVPGETVPEFEFRGLAARLGTGALLLRDHHASWFQQGALGVADDFAGLLAWLDEQVQRLRPSRLVLLGNSAGAYAALAAGAVLDADEVLAFVPRSALADEVNAALGDDRLLDRRARVAPSAQVPDLVTHLAMHAAARQPRPYRTRNRVFHALDNALDTAHAHRLAGLPETVVAAYPRGDHQLASVLRASGELDALVGTALAGLPRALTERIAG